jgi:hypothetical protein
MPFIALLIVQFADWDMTDDANSILAFRKVEKSSSPKK